jgi:hypothetical protein
MDALMPMASANCNIDEYNQRCQVVTSQLLQERLADILQAKELHWALHKK